MITTINQYNSYIGQLYAIDKVNETWYTFCICTLSDKKAVGLQLNDKFAQLRLKFI